MSLYHYNAVRRGRLSPRFQRARSVPLPAAGEPWQRHHAGVARLHAAEAALDTAEAALDTGASPCVSVAGAPSLLDLKIELADATLDSCDLCPHHCFVNRNQG